MKDSYILLERHEQQLKSLAKDVADLRAVQAEIRAMNETLVTLATELKHTNRHLESHEKRLKPLKYNCAKSYSRSLLRLSRHWQDA